MANVSSSNGLEKRPKLRFPGFDEPYRSTQLGDIAALVNRTDPKSNAPIMMLSAGNGFIMQSDKYSRDNAGQSLKKYILLKQGELAYNHGASKAKQFGCCYELTEPEARIPYVYHCFKINNHEYTPFIAMALNNAKMDKQLKRLVSSSVRMDGLLNISFEDYMSVTIHLPSPSEQKHIADFLQIIDERIATQEKLLASLKKYKRGLSSSLFDEISKSGCPTVSFTDGFRLLQNNTFSRDDLSYDVGDVRNIHYGDVLIKYGTVTDIGALSVPCIKPDRNIEKFSSSSYLRNGDIVFADTAEDYTVGKATEIVGVTHQRVLSGLHTIPCRPHDRFAPMFLGHYFNSYHFRRQIYRMIQGIKVSSISKSEIAKTTILTPPCDVQRKVASVLSEVDHLIEKEAETAIVLQKIRCGLLQQLFI